MKKQFIKDIYYQTIGKLSLVSFYWSKIASKKYDGACLNIGCGSNYIQGMVNIDANIFRKKDLWLDITLGLPFADKSIRGIYTSHMLEHLRVENLQKFLGECFRVLLPGGVMRISVPSLEYAIKAYSDKDLTRLGEWPHKFESVGGRFNNFMLCDNQHFVMLDFGFLKELLIKAGFKHVEKVNPSQSNLFSQEELKREMSENRKESSLYVEAYKTKLSKNEE